MNVWRSSSTEAVGHSSSWKSTLRSVSKGGNRAEYNNRGQRRVGLVDRQIVSDMFTRAPASKTRSKIKKFHIAWLGHCQDKSGKIPRERWLKYKSTLRPRNPRSKTMGPSQQEITFPASLIEGRDEQGGIWMWARVVIEKDGPVKEVAAIQKGDRETCCVGIAETIGDVYFKNDRRLRSWWLRGDKHATVTRSEVESDVAMMVMFPTAEQC
ncbi:hypothetical protein C8F04DRAFT_1200139 [Mycena alexandri]|uniref:Uncharacterized protein n=1 Tax=Mycena alexandri TaxID=1745969 RepID=A0AAD6WM69_9AGAR|nr:hypothetical protein C8F04DRAFT_1200139 [Mycena alexandri]